MRWFALPWLLILACAAPRVTIYHAPSGTLGELRSGVDPKSLLALVRNGEFGRAEQVLALRPLDSALEVRVAQGLLSCRSRRNDLAESLLRPVFTSQADTGLRRLAYFGLSSVLAQAERFQALESLERQALAEQLSKDTTALLTARVLSRLPPTVIIARAPSTELKMKRGLSGCPLAKVSVNGSRLTDFWFDTGASFCVISEPLARRVGVQLLTQELGYAGTATDRKVPFRLGLIDTLLLGDYVIANLPVMVMRPKDLNLGIPGFRIDGVIGWSLLSKFRMTIDYADRWLRFECPVPQGQPVHRNLFSLGGVPLVETAVNGSGPLHFILDTGAGASLVQESGLAKLAQEPALAVSLGCVGGAGGGDVRGQRLLRNAALTLDRYTVAPLNLMVHKLPVEDFPVAVDGLLGEDLLGNFTVTIDAPNGRVALVRPISTRP
ncbi:MAG: retropepsin-like aspartic protease [candidate division WOR-3 bacterium]